MDLRDSIPSAAAAVARHTLNRSETASSGITDCPDDNKSPSDDEFPDDSGDSDDIEQIFTQHDLSLSQCDDDGDSVDDYIAGLKSADWAPKSNVEEKSNQTNHGDDDNYSYLDSDNDDELMNLGAIVEAEHSPHKNDKQSTALSSTFRSAQTQAVAPNHSTAPKSVARGSAAPSASLDSTPKTRNLKRHLSPPHADKEIPSTKKKKQSCQRKLSGFFSKKDPTTNISHGCKISALSARTVVTTRLFQQNKTDGKPIFEYVEFDNGVAYTMGEIWQSFDKDYKGFAFKLGKMHCVNNIHEAEITHVWCKIERTFLGKEFADQFRGALIESTGTDWVLLKKHEKLPKGTMNLINFCGKLTTNLPDERKSLCYEKIDKFNHSYYYENGERQHFQAGSVRPKSLDLFAGAGGMSIGLEGAGFDVKFKVEMNKSASDTLNMNFPTSIVFTEDIEKFIISCKEAKVKIYPQKGSVVHVHASPPCQGVSAANTSGGKNDLQNNLCTLQVVEVIKILSPDLFSMENVPGLTQQKNLEYLLKIMVDLLTMGYQVRFFPVVASDYGDPQDRKRFILLAARRGYKLPSIPKPTHGKKGLARKVTAGDALNNLEDVELVESGFVQTKTGAVLWGHFQYGTSWSGKDDKKNRLCYDFPAQTVMKENKIKHYKHARSISILERARLQSFPDGYKFGGCEKDVQDQIGNAVPVKLAKAIGEVLMKSYRLGLHSPIG